MIGFLAEARIAVVSDADLHNPNPDFMSNLYTKILTHLDWLQEDHGQLDSAALEQLEKNHQYVDSVRTMNLLGKIKKLLASVECPERFTRKDLIMLNTERTELFLSAILTFCIYRDTKMNLLRPMVEEMTLLDKQLQELEDRISQLNVEQHNESREIVDAVSIVEEIRQAVSGLNNDQRSAKAVIRTLKDRAIKVINHTIIALHEAAVS
ncbi:hypothetical protein U1Q18_004711 [Sarracenia purpurea var. burkii]